ncbi:MAG: DUF423 domain-containing protein [Bosea sp. (in: a-proteobacteria)]
MTTSRIHLAIACLFGAGGVALWAWATHAAQPSATIAAQMLIMHAAAIVALTAARDAGLMQQRAAIIFISALAVGVTLFAGDLAFRAISGQRLFPMASPIGGMLMIAGWLGLAVTPFLVKRS